jgi:hypothetical protein
MSSSAITHRRGWEGVRVALRSLRMRSTPVLLVVTAVGCSSAPADGAIVLPTPSSAGARVAPASASARGPRGAGPIAFDIAYSTYGLMPFPKCGTETYRIEVARDHAVRCGWAYACPPYEAHPLEPVPKGTLDDEQIENLAELASSDGFRALPKFDSNPHIIDGGMRTMTVHLGDREQIVELANVEHEAFSTLFHALEAATGCSMETAGPRPR